ncbi:ribosome small subunit-dependent GTPase A [Auraticoccus monumenti]|uniref:Small ribosomal subunit biogenesis GTPase RsgA n=1 Tax=Auraticoccus monumenti TaxID=675864 RepID=A0A1G7AWB0_9ACTN|nr:ribosome small subunit-dependent GTPase A [Auraticoccus monumenti]SDE18285.1 ribosome biogenesis GTPase [Auraticoccus monumenti]
MRSRGGLYSDDHAGFDRPRRHTRPRTKDRPDYSEAAVARVITVDRGRYRLQLDGRMVSATKARALGRAGVIVGDRVRVVGDTSGEEGTLARVVGVEERETVLRRTADDDDPFERPIVANADQLAIITALADPPPRAGMIDRILVAGWVAGLDPLLVLTKADLAPADEILAAYEPLDVPVLTTQPGAELGELRERLDGRTTVFVGHSGVGKSTLVNALIPGLDRAVGVVNETTGRGRHTSTSAIALALPDDAGWVIDTPGVRSFGLSHVTPAGVVAAFPDLAASTVDCPRGCHHDSAAAGCGLDAAVAAGRLPPARVQSFRRILDARMIAEREAHRGLE